MSQPLHIWGHGTPRTLRVYWALHEFDIDYVKHPVRTRTADMDNPEFLAVSPGKKIPAMTHGELTLTESGAITEYIFRLAGRAPAAPAVAAEVERWSCFALTEIDATALYVLRRHDGLPEIYGEAPRAVDAAIAYFERQISVVAAVLDDGRDYLAGTEFSKADIMLASCCVWAEYIELPLPPSVVRWSAAITARPAFESAVAVNNSNSA